MLVGGIGMLVGARTGTEPAVEAGVTAGAEAGATVGLEIGADGVDIEDSGKRGVTWGIGTALVGAMDSPK